MSPVQASAYLPSQNPVVVVAAGVEALRPLMEDERSSMTKRPMPAKEPQVVGAEAEAAGAAVERALLPAHASTMVVAAVAVAVEAPYRPAHLETHSQSRTGLASCESHRER